MEAIASMHYRLSTIRNASDLGDLIYNAVPLTGTTLPAVRVVNGTNLLSSYGLGIVTPMPMYVWGNFNVLDQRHRRQWLGHQQN